jgi:hypothetical protein
MDNRSSFKRVRANDVALIGVVLLALGLAVLIGGARVGGRLPLTGALWGAALLFFAAARQPGRRS